jgi:hypothetical protein
MVKESEIFKEAREFLSGEREEIPIEKSAFYDKRTKQISLKIPKEICIAEKINPKSKFVMVINPKENTWEKVKKLNFVIYLKEEKE